jgi:poly [ADP-ribose] polymerase
VAGKYTLLERDYSNKDDTSADLAAENDSGAAEKAESKLDRRVQELIQLICNVQMMKDQMTEVGYDIKKMPLGSLSKEQIKKGYSVLKQISEILDSGKSNHHTALRDLSSEFYTLIPHVFGMSVPPVIRDKVMLKQKLEMCESLAEIDVAVKLLRSDASKGGDINPIDLHYEALNCEMQPLDQKSAEFQMIKKYVKQTHGSTHNNYDLEVLEVFALDRQGEKARYQPFNSDKNRQLLFHGSRLTNFMGIISQGLRIAPPEAPVTGYMFGKGVYFADCVSKSANYCFTTAQNNIGCMLLCDVALGEMNELTQSDYYADKLPKGKLSTKGLGQHAPDPLGAVTIEDGLIVPLGNTKATNVKQSSLLYNEFIVYDTAQIKMKYLMKIKFNYKNRGF